MTNKSDFMAYEYKDISVRRDSAVMYTDCLSNFGWMPIEDDMHGLQSILSSLNPVNIGMNIVNAAQASSETLDGAAMVTLKFKRNRRMENKHELDKLERKCKEALTAINNMQRKNNAYTMGISLGTGIVGTAFIGLAVYNFVFSNIVLGVIFSVVGAIGWIIGFFSNRRISNKKSAQTEPKIQEQLDIVYSACEQAHGLFA